MLTTLRIKNLALVDDLTLELQPGYNAITGETGAGKSILIGALNLVRRRAALEAEKASLIVDERTYAQQLDLLRHQAGEIAAAGLRPDEEEELEREHRLAANSSRLLELAHSALRQLNDDESSLTI